MPPRLCGCGCGEYANPGKRFIHGHNAATGGTPLSPEHKAKIAKSHEGIPLSEEHKKALSKSRKGRIFSVEHREKITAANTGKIRTEEIRQHYSACKQGIPYEDWTEYVSDGEYCHKFDEACRERIRAKYDYRCFVCDRPQDENIDKNNNVWKLSVHHVDKNKDQGCNGHAFNLIPMCNRCHPKAHYDPLYSRLVYLSNHIQLSI